jgi:hypothetical protein
MKCQFVDPSKIDMRALKVGQKLCVWSFYVEREATVVETTADYVRIEVAQTGKDGRHWMYFNYDGGQIGTAAWVDGWDERPMVPFRIKLCACTEGEPIRRFSLDCVDRTDFTHWTMTLCASSSEEARETFRRIAPNSVLQFMYDVREREKQEAARDEHARTHTVCPFCKVERTNDDHAAHVDTCPGFAALKAEGRI